MAEKTVIQVMDEKLDLLLARIEILDEKIEDLNERLREVGVYNGSIPTEDGY